MSNLENINFPEINKRMKIVNSIQDAEAREDEFYGYVNSGELSILEEEYARYCLGEKKVVDWSHKMSKYTTMAMTYVLAVSTSTVVTSVIKEQAKDLEPFKSKVGRAMLSLGTLGVHSVVYGFAYQKIRESIEIPPEKINATCVKNFNKSRKKAGLPPLDSCGVGGILHD